MPGLTIIDAPIRERSGWKSSAAMLLRCLLVLSIAVAIRVGSEQRSDADATSEIVAQLADVQLLVDEAAELKSPSGGLSEILDKSGQSRGFAVTTLPSAADIVGYRGPSNVLLVLDAQLCVTRAKLIGSDDTPEHVEAIHRDDDFLPQFTGWILGQPDSFRSVDATTGATLTSLAIAEGIAVRLGSEKPSLRFPDDVDTTDLKLLFDNAGELRLRSVDVAEAEVLAADDKVIGRLIRTGPLVDSVAGYQGPSELIAAVGMDGIVNSIALRRTWDNQPYAGYLNDEPYFWKPFQQKTLLQLQQFDPEAEQIEGVSGATMTSLAVADTIVAAAKAYGARQAAAAAPKPFAAFRWRLHDWGTLIVLGIGILIGMTSLRGRRWLRVVWNVVLVAYLGLVTGNLISLAIVMGWAAKGIAWRLAPGLFLVVLISLIMPPLTRRNLYCSHLCPHGAAQQLLKNRVQTSWRISAAWSRRLRWLPGGLLVTAVLLTLLGQNWNLAAWEPFNAYIWYVAGASSITLALVSLGASAVVPMAYCRYGCATGRLLDYLRRSSHSRRFTFADGCVVLMAALAWGLVLNTATLLS